MLEVFNTQFWCDIVWALLHSIWQAAIIALLLGIILRQISAKQATLRYWLATGAILSLVLASFFTYHVRTELRKSSASPVVQQVAPLVVSEAVSKSPPAELAHIPSLQTSAASGINWTALAALFWVVGVSAMVLRTIGAVIRGNQLSSVSPIETPKYLELFTKQSQEIGLRKVPSFWSSASGCTPYAVGVLAPAVVVPMSMLTSLSSSELQAVLAHELAHVRRNDYLVNLYQMVIESVYFFNPAVWWISRQIRIEREACCDQIAIEAAGNNIGYAQILANWMETVLGDTDSKVDQAPAAAMAFSNKQPSGMLERIQRILKPDSKPKLRVSPLNWGFVIAASILIACGMNIGSKAVTAVAVQALSDSERIAKIKERQVALEDHADGVFEEGTATIRGRITTEDGGEVEDGRLSTTSENSNSSTHKGGGRFSAGQDFKTTVKSGEVWLELFSNNYAPAIIGPIKAVKDISITQNVTLVKGAPHLVHVVDEDGQPVSGADVQMYPKSHGGPVWKNSTDDQGNYTYKHRNPGGESNLRVEKVGYVREDKVVTNNGKTEVVLKTAPISKGVVLSADGKPVVDAEIRIASTRTRAFLHKLIARTDKQGRFETPMLFPTELYEILVVSDNGATIVEDVTPSENLKFTLRPPCTMDVTIKGDLDQLRRKRNGELEIVFWQRTRKSLRRSDEKESLLDVVEDSEDQVRLKLKRLLAGKLTLKSGKFRGTLEATPGNNTVEIMIDAETNKTTTAGGVEKTDLKISFECDGETVKPSGLLRLRHNYSPLNDGHLKVSVEPGKYFLQPDRLIGFTFEGQMIEVVAGQLNEITIEVEPAGAVSGTVVDVDGNPLSTSVSCRYEYRHSSTGLSGNFRSDEKGKFLLTPIPLGAKVVAKAGERFNPAVSDEVLIEASKPVVDVQLQTAAPVKAKVRVIDDQGKPIYGSELTVSLTGHGSWSGSLVTDAKGECEISPLHPTRDYTVEAEPKRYVKKNIDLVQGETNILQLEQGAELRGQLLDKDGNPVPNQRVYAMFKNPRSSQGLPTWVDADRLTDSDGRFEFTRLPKTECEINSPYGSEPVLINAGEDNEPIELRLKE